MQWACAGEITPKMRKVDKREELDSEMVRIEIAKGRMVISSNVKNVQLNPMGIDKIAK